MNLRALRAEGQRGAVMADRLVQLRRLQLRQGIGQGVVEPEVAGITPLPGPQHGHGRLGRPRLSQVVPQQVQGRGRHLAPAGPRPPASPAHPAAPPGPAPAEGRPPPAAARGPRRPATSSSRRQPWSSFPPRFLRTMAQSSRPAARWAAIARSRSRARPRPGSRASTSTPYAAERRGVGGVGPGVEFLVPQDRLRPAGSAPARPASPGRPATAGPGPAARGGPGRRPGGPRPGGPPGPRRRRGGCPAAAPAPGRQGLAHLRFRLGPTSPAHVPRRAVHREPRDRQDQRRRHRATPPAPRGCGGRTCRADTTPTAGTPPPAGRSGSASRRRRSRWPSRSAGGGPSPAPSSRPSRARPCTDDPSRLGSAFRRAETVESRSPSELSRVLGLGGSSSRMIRRISSNAARLSVSESKGVVPVSSS